MSTDSWAQGKETRIIQFNRVTFGVACSPFLLNATIRHHLSLCDQAIQAISVLMSHLYMDDWLTGADKEEMRQLCSQGTSIMADAGMSCTKWKCSDFKLLPESKKQVPVIPCGTGHV